VINKISSLLNIDEMLHWRIVQRGFWALNVNCLEDFFKSMENFKVSHIAQNIRCPTLITLPEGDPIASGALALYKALNVSNKKLVHYKFQNDAAKQEFQKLVAEHPKYFERIEANPKR
jgi:hypothetical protein